MCHEYYWTLNQFVILSHCVAASLAVTAFVPRYRAVRGTAGIPLFLLLRIARSGPVQGPRSRPLPFDRCVLGRVKSKVHSGTVSSRSILPVRLLWHTSHLRWFYAALLRSDLWGVLRLLTVDIYVYVKCAFNKD